MKILTKLKKCTGNAATKACEVSSGIQVGSRKVKSKIGRALAYEQHIAFFGEEGSGKTTLLNVFYGKQQEFKFIRENGYSLLAEDSGQGKTLLDGYNQLKDAGSLNATRLYSQSYSFLVKPAFEPKRKGVLKIVWHDYPGEWLSGRNKPSAAEDQRKIETFRALIKSDVAFILIDGQRLKEQGGGYIKSVFSQLKDELIRLKDRMANDLPLKYFPRVWTICLSKADLFAEWKISDFKGEVLKFASDEIESLRVVLGQFVKHPEKMDFPSSYLLLSSAKYDPNTLKLVDWGETVGVDCIAPISILAPILSVIKWANVKEVGSGTVRSVLRVGADLCSSLSSWAPVVAAWLATMVCWIPFVGKPSSAVLLLSGFLVKAVLDSAALIMKGGAVGLQNMKEKAKAKKDSLSYVVAAFQGKLQECRDCRVYVESEQDMKLLPE